MPRPETHRHFPWSAIWVLLLAAQVHAHPVSLAQAKLQLDTTQRTYELLLDCDVTAFVMGSKPGHLSKTLTTALGTMTETEMDRQVARLRDWFITQLDVTIDRTKHEPVTVAFPPIATLRQVKLVSGGEAETEHSTITIRGSLPEDGRAMVVRLPGEIGGVLLVTRRDSADLPPQLLAAGQPCQPLPVKNASGDTTTAQGEATSETGIEDHSIPPGVITAGQFLALGFWHIIPQGLDHIFFVLGLFLLSPTLKPLLWQVTAFTLAHSITLVLAMSDVIRLSSFIVEPLIAASIVLIAIENVFTTNLKPWRPFVVFAFGLLHGLGFAGVMSELDLPAGQFLPAILGFNLGVEAGQLSVIAIAFLAVGWARTFQGYRNVVTIPASLAIAVVGIYWTIERIST